jgi:hypothetical protein
MHGIPAERNRHVRLLLAFRSGKERASLLPPPLRTVRAILAAHGSSLYLLVPDRRCSRFRIADDDLRRTSWRTAQCRAGVSNVQHGSDECGPGRGDGWRAPPRPERSPMSPTGAGRSRCWYPPMSRLSALPTCRPLCRSRRCTPPADRSGQDFDACSCRCRPHRRRTGGRRG